MKDFWGRVGVLGLVCVFASAPPASAQTDVEIPDHAVRTVFTTDTIEGFGAVGGVVADGLGYVYVADFRNAVWRYSPDGAVEKFADGLYGASGNAIGPRGYLFQSAFNGNYVARISRTGDVEVWADEGLSGPVGIAAAPDGSLFVVNCTAGTVSRIGPDRSVSTFAESELMACPNGITFDDRGDLFVVSFNSTKIVRITPDGTATEFADIPGGGGNGHITFARGAFYVTKFRANQIHEVYRDGTSALLAGTGQPGRGDGAAAASTFTQPNGITSTSGGRELWVNDLVVRGSARTGRSLVSLRRIDLTTLTDVLAEVDPAEGADAVRTVYDAYHRSRPRDDTSVEAVAVAYGWMSSPNWQTGVALMEMNADRYPQDPASVFNRGEAYRYTGQPQQAAEQYRRVLELQPNHPSARARLAEVGGGPPQP